MVAVIQYVRDAALSVTLPEGCQRCTPSCLTQIAHGNVSPTSPPVQLIDVLSEQAELCSESKSLSRSLTSPTRLSKSNFNYTLNKQLREQPSRPRCYPAVIQPLLKTDESATREKPKRSHICREFNKTAFCRNFEVRCSRDISKRPRNNPSNLAERNTPSGNRKTRAVVETISREVAALPRVEPTKRNVAVPLSPISSITHRCPEAPFAASFSSSAFKSVQTILNNIPTKICKLVEATTSSIELLTVNRWQSNHSRRKTKSQEEFRTRKDGFKKEMLQILKNIDWHDDEVCQVLRDELVRKIKKNRRKMNLRIDGRAISAPFWSKATCRNCVDNCRKFKNVDIYRAEIRSIGVPNENRLDNTVNDWLQEIHTKNSELLEQRTLDLIVSSLAEKFRLVCLNSEYITKSEIMQIIEEVTFDASDNDRNVRLKNIADAPTDKIKDMLQSDARKLYRPRVRNPKQKHSKCFPCQKLIQPTKEEVKSFVKEKLLVLIKKFHLKFDSRNIRDVETELVDVLIDSLGKLHWDDNDKVKEEVAIALQDTNKMPDNYYTCLADTLVKHFKNYMGTVYGNNVVRAEQQTFVVLQNTVQNTSVQPNNVTDIGAESLTEADVEAHIERYTSQLTQVIEEWWTSILGDDENEKGFTEVAINDLAGDIVDRHRFLGLDTSKRSSDEEEIDYLRFQIFRWINKLVSDEAMQQALDRAPELMELIQRILIPIVKTSENLQRPQNLVKRPLSPTPARSIISGRVPPTNSSYNVNQTPTFGPAGQGGIIPESSSKRGPASRRMSEPTANSIRPMSYGLGGTCRPPPERRYSEPVNPRENLNTKLPSIPKIYKDFTNYLNDWVDQIPIPENNSQEQDLAKKLRRDIYNGFLMAYVKVEMNPTQFRNEFYLQDFFEKELEDLLSNLQLSQETRSKYALLKAKLTKRATDTIKAIRKANTSTSYRYRLWDAITSTLPPRPMVEDRNKSTEHLFEELLKLNIVEDYLLFRLHLNMNKPKAEAHRNKISISIRKLYDNATLLPGNDGIPADVDDFSQKIVQCMVNVEIPPRDTKQGEADQIVLSHELSQWMQDLPIPQSDMHLDQLQRRRLRDSLAKKIHEIEKQTDLCDNSALRLMRNELSKFLEKFAPRPEASENLSFLIDEFINRLKNRHERVQSATDFPMFFKHVPLSSSFVEQSGPVFITESLSDWANLGSPGTADPRLLGAELVPVAPPFKEPTNTQWRTLLKTQEQLQRERDAQASAVHLQQIPLCCQPAPAMNLRQQAISDHLGHHMEQMAYQKPSSLKPLTMLNTQQEIEREKQALKVQTKSQQIPPCCKPALGASQIAYDSMGPGLYEPVHEVNVRSLHPSQVAEASYRPLVSAGRRVGAPTAVPSMHSNMRPIVDLQDRHQSKMQEAITAARPGPGGVTSFFEPQAPLVSQMPIVPSVSGVSGISQMPGPSELAHPRLGRPSDPGYRGTPMRQRPIRPRQLGSPQQVMSGRSVSNQSQFQKAAPWVQEEAQFAARHDFYKIPDQNISRPMVSPIDLSIQVPVGFSTPRQSLEDRGGAPEVAAALNGPGEPRVRRPRLREGEMVRPDAACRRLDPDVEEEEERERDEIQCRCTEHVYRCRRRRPMCCDCEDMDYPRHYFMPYPYCFF